MPFVFKTELACWVFPDSSEKILDTDDFREFTFYEVG
jgi:hypothetical protein